MDYLAALGGWLTEGKFFSTFSVLRAIFLFLDAILVVLFMFVFMRCLETRPRFVWSPRKARSAVSRKDPEIQARWVTLLRKAPVHPPQSYALAIIEADKLTDEALKRLGFQGEHMADRLEKLNVGGMRTLDDLWRVHRLRNELVHAPDFEISEVHAKEVLRVYEKFLAELGVI